MQPEAANGSSGATKKRKKEVLKPIITTEKPSSPGYVLLNPFLSSVRPVQSVSDATSHGRVKRQNVSESLESSDFPSHMLFELM